jgi:DNA-binding transcriptional LysR family regulator
MTSLRAFEAVLRHGSLSAAARELCVTPAAISHRLRDLERACGQPLVIRRNGRFAATPLGRDVAAILGDAFLRIRQADSLLSGAGAGIVRVTAPYSFATLWLAGHLPQFEAMHAEADLRILPSHDPLNEGPADVTIVHSDRRPDGDWSLLFHDVCAVMARPDHPFVTAPPTDLSEIWSAQLVHVGAGHGSARGAFTWARWGQAMGLDGGPTARGAHLTAEHLAVDFLQRKEALGLISLVNVADHLARDLLAVVPGTAVRSDCSYWIHVRPTPGRTRGTAEHFADWLQGCFPGEVSVTTTVLAPTAGPDGMSGAMRQSAGAR